MSKVDEAKAFLDAIGMPRLQQNDMCAYVLLALADIKAEDHWAQASSTWIRIHDIIQFTNTNYGLTYKENSRETFRKQALHHFRNAALIEDNGMATNSPNYRYRLTGETLITLRTIGSREWDNAIQLHLSAHTRLIETYSSKRSILKMPVKINGVEFTFSTGSHNKLQKAIIEEFAPRFAPNSECLYVGDTIVKDLLKDAERLARLGFSITLHDKMPDVILYDEERNWLFFVEAVTSVGPMNPKRLLEISEMAGSVTAGLIFITAFLDLKTYKKFVSQLAWDTEVWIAEMPDHMVHLNGDRFLGPRDKED
jgi:hypothetical protein